MFQFARSLYVFSQLRGTIQAVDTCVLYMYMYMLTCCAVRM